MSDNDDEKKAKVKKALFESLFSADDFFGTGLSIQQFIALGEAKKYRRSYGVQDRAEKDRRLRYIIELSCILKEIEEQTQFGTRTMERDIQAIIEGDRMLLKGRESMEPLLRKDWQWTPCPELYRKFHRMVESCVRTWPDDDNDNTT